MSDSKIMIQGQWIKMVKTDNEAFSIGTSDARTIFVKTLLGAPDPTKTEVGMFLVLTTAALPVYVCDGTAWVEVTV